jgi:RHS repeat-associated protein
VSGTSIEVYHTDRLGSVRALTTAAGAVTATYRSDEWGRPTASTGSSGQPYAFTGEPRDATGLTYLRTRYYDSDLGRFMSRDSWPGMPTVGQTQNRYAYVTNNPLLAPDRNGRFLDVILDAAFIVYDVASLIFGPEKDRGMNLLGLAADVGSLFIPFVTGGGAAARAGAHVAEHADDARDATRWLEDAGRAAAACSFTAETLVATPKGAVPISSIAVGDIVLAWDQATGKIVARTVTALLRHPDHEIARVIIGNVVVATTPNHPFYTVEAGWVTAGMLWNGAHLVSTSGTVVVSSVETEPFSGLLWNLTVDRAHTFFVGDSQVLVHNNCPALFRRSIADPSALRGASVQDVTSQIPSDWVSSPTRGEGGVRYADPSRPGDQIRIMPGNPLDSDPVKRGPYLVVSVGGNTSEHIPLAGNPVLP